MHAKRHSHSSLTSMYPAYCLVQSQVSKFEKTTLPALNTFIKRLMCVQDPELTLQRTVLYHKVLLTNACLTLDLLCMNLCDGCRNLTAAVQKTRTTETLVALNQAAPLPSPAPFPPARAPQPPRPVVRPPTQSPPPPRKAPPPPAAKGEKVA